LYLKSFPGLVFVIILALSFASVFPQGPGVLNPSASDQAPNTGVSLEVHVANQFGVWYNGAFVEVFDQSAASQLVANGTTVEGEYFAGDLTAGDTFLVQVYTTNGGQANQTVVLTSNSAIVNFVIPSTPTPALSIEHVVVNASTSTPGAPFSITADIVNTSNSTAYNAAIQVSPPPQFSLIGTGSDVFLGNLRNGTSTPLSLQLSVSGVTATPDFIIKYLLNFSDYNGTSFSTTGTISLPTPLAPTLAIQSVTLNPPIIQPGSTFSLTAVIVNTSNSTAFDGVLTVAPPTDYSLLSTGSVIPFGTLQPGGSKSLTLQLVVSNSATPTASNIEYLVNYTDYFLDKYATTGTISVPVSGNPVSPKLIITTATFSSMTIHPGDNFTVPITIENVGTVPALEVVLSVNATSPVVTTGSAGVYRLGVIPANGSTSVTLGFTSPPNSVLGSFPIVLTLAYEDTFGTIYSSQQALVATLVGEPSLVFNILQFKNNPLTPGLETFFNAQLVNTGGAPALNVKVMFQNAPAFLGNTTIFLGGIQPGETGNATSYLQIPDNTAVGAYQFIAVVSYTDSVGRTYEVQAPYTVTVAPFSPPMVSVTNTLLSPEVLAPGTQGTLTIYLKNSGATPANNVTLSLLNASHIFSSDLFGLGTIDEGGSVTTTVGVNVGSALKGGSYLVKVEVTYNDDNGMRYNFTLPLEMNVYATSSALTVKNIGIGAAVVIIGAAIYLGVTRRKKTG
jgi:hypothetical protein